MKIRDLKRLVRNLPDDWAVLNRGAGCPECTVTEVVEEVDARDLHPVRYVRREIRNVWTDEEPVQASEEVFEGLLLADTRGLDPLPEVFRAHYWDETEDAPDGELPAMNREITQRYGPAFELLARFDQGDEAARGEAGEWAELGPEDIGVTVEALRSELGKLAGDGFGVLRDRDAEDVLAAIGQEVFGDRLYPTPQRRAAQLMVRTIKSHPYIDGNKRIGAALMVRYLERTGLRVRIDPVALAVLAMWTAASRPEEHQDQVRAIELIIEAST